MTAATTSPPAVAPSHEPLMLDWLLPEFDATLIEHRVIDADPAAVYRAVATVNMVERQRLAQQGVVAQVDLADGEVVRRTPPRVETAEFVGRERLGHPARLAIHDA